jgi:hypothetical protein
MLVIFPYVKEGSEKKNQIRGRSNESSFGQGETFKRKRENGCVPYLELCRVLVILKACNYPAIKHSIQTQIFGFEVLWYL